MRHRPALVAVASCCLALAARVVRFSDYHLFQLTLVRHLCDRALGPQPVTGYNGQISLGHGAFYAIGAYTTAILMAQFGRAVLGDDPGLGAGLRRFGFLSACRRCGWAAFIWRWPRSRSRSRCRRS